MARKILSWVLIVLSALLLLASVAGIGAAWIYNEPLTNAATSRLNAIDKELAQAQVTLASTRAELERALRLVEAAEQALEKLAQQSTDAETLFEGIQQALDDRLLPELKLTRERINAARAALESFQAALEGVAGFIPGLDLSGPGTILTDLIQSANSLDSEIARAEEVARQASTFVSDTSYLLGGDLTETRDSLLNFLAAVQEYQAKVAGWRGQVAELTDSLPGWIDRASVSLTLFLLWFALSQFSLLLHGLSLRRGENPLAGWRWKS